MFDMTHSHPDQAPFRSDDDYVLASRCSNCGASPGDPCSAPNKAGRPHAIRQDRGRVKLSRDVGRAPYPEDREPGACYSTLPGCE